MDVIVVENLVKKFGSAVLAVDNVSFGVREGEIFGFLGPNGAGKTTTINVLTTVLKPSSGRATVCGFDIARQQTEVRRCIGVVPQEYTADEDLTGEENVMLCASLCGIAKNVAKERAKELLELVKMENAKDRRVETYSGGMRRRLELACGLINRPRTLFLDEPTLGLDVQTRRAVWSYIKLLKEQYRMTLFMTTHYLEEADNLCDRIGIIDRGRLIKLDSPQALKLSLGGDLIELTIDNSAPDMSDVLGKVPNVKKVKKEEATYRLTVANGEEVAPVIIEVIRASGHKVNRISLTRPTLDEVYLELTGKSMREVQADETDAWKHRLTIRRARG